MSEESYMILQDGIKIPLKAGYSYTSRWDYLANVGSKRDSEILTNRLWASPIHSYAVLTSQSRLLHFNISENLKELVLGDNIVAVNFWTDITVDNPVILPKGLEYATLPYGFIISNLGYFVGDDKVDIAFMELD